MKIYLTPPQPSRGLQRIADALIRYLPEGWKMTTVMESADLIIIYVIGRHDAVERQVQELMKRGQRYAVVQVCLRSTMKPHTKHWEQMWRGATAVWSYYDLRQAMLDDGWPMMVNINFYHAPLGADASYFFPYSNTMRAQKDYMVISSGDSRLSESVRECHLAAKAVNKFSCHLGPRLGISDIDYYSDIDDTRLAQLYSSCQFVSALRRIEGFELPGIEGLLCGARPVCFDSADWRWNYGDHAEYIQETNRQGVVDQLVELFKRGARPVTEDELQLARERFNWKTIVMGFYERLK